MLERRKHRYCRILFIDFQSFWKRFIVRRNEELSKAGARKMDPVPKQETVVPPGPETLRRWK